MSLKFGIIGAGHMAERMADTVRQMKQVELYAVASRTEEKAKAFAENTEQRYTMGIMRH